MLQNFRFINFLTTDHYICYKASDQNLIQIFENYNEQFSQTLYQSLNLSFFIRLLEYNEKIIQIFNFIHLELVNNYDFDRIQQFLKQKYDNYIYMDLTLFKRFIDCSQLAQQHLETSRVSLKSLNISNFTLFKVFSIHSAPDINLSMMIKFLNSFSWQLQLIDQQQIQRELNYKYFSSNKNRSDQQTLLNGIKLFLHNWGSHETINFDQFSVLITGAVSFPSREKQCTFQVRKKLFDFIIQEIQDLINLQIFRRAIFRYYFNLTDLFQMLTSSHNLTKSSIQNIYLTFGQRKNQRDLQRIQTRLNLPLNRQQFLKDFMVRQEKKKPSKILYSSAKKIKNFQSSNQNQTEFKTPQKNKQNKIIYSTRLTKGQKIEQLSLSRKALSEQQEAFNYCTEQYLQVLGQILRIETNYINFKKQIVLSPDFDLQLVYETFGVMFSNILNKCYGSCNFTSFVRFIIPQDFEHRYLCFIHYQKTNSLSDEIKHSISQIIAFYFKKEQQIAQIWEKFDKQIVFRSYCQPNSQEINKNEILKFFTQRQAKILLDRFDSCRTGFISFENFK